VAPAGSGSRSRPRWAPTRRASPRTCDPWLGDRVGVGYWTGTRTASWCSPSSATRAAPATCSGGCRRPPGSPAPSRWPTGGALVLTGTAEVDLSFRALLAQRAAERLAAGAALRGGLAALPARQTALAWVDLAQRAAVARAFIMGYVESATEAPPS
jgi:hypothetical protein